MKVYIKESKALDCSKPKVLAYDDETVSCPFGYRPATEKEVEEFLRECSLLEEEIDAAEYDGRTKTGTDTVL
jgi:hypothetical protein